jgi:hypothetical protein
MQIAERRDLLLSVCEDTAQQIENTRPTIDLILSDFPQMAHNIWMEWIGELKNGEMMEDGLICREFYR